MSSLSDLVGAGGGIKWIAVSANGTLTAKQGELVTSGVTPIERTLPATLAVGDSFTINAQGGAVHVLPGTHTIRHDGEAIDGTFLIIERGQTANLVAGSTTTVEIV